MNELGANHGVSYFFIYSGSIADIVLGLAIFIKRYRREVIILQVLLILVYMVILAIFSPHYWLHPFGVLSKNIPLIALSYYLLKKKFKFKFYESVYVFRLTRQRVVVSPLPFYWSIIVTNNDILRRIRYTFNFNDSKMISLFGLGEKKVTRTQVSDWLKNEDDPAYKNCSDIHLAVFLNGLIIDKRGKKDGPQPKPEQRLTNNIIFRKLRIALNLKDEDILKIMDYANFRMSTHELSAFFRKADHINYRECKDQILRNFLKGVQLKYRVNIKSEKGVDPNKQST